MQPRSVNHFALVTGAALGLLGVLIGAFGAHALDNLLSLNQRQDTFELANRYHFYHALALILIGITANPAQSKMRNYASLCILLGILVFSGSLYLLAVTNMGFLGAITPIGGVLLLIGWALFLVSLLRA